MNSSRLIYVVVVVGGVDIVENTCFIRPELVNACAETGDKNKVSGDELWIDPQNRKRGRKTKGIKPQARGLHQGERRSLCSNRRFYSAERKHLSPYPQNPQHAVSTAVDEKNISRPRKKFAEEKTIPKISTVHPQNGGSQSLDAAA